MFMFCIFYVDAHVHAHICVYYLLFLCHAHVTYPLCSRVDGQVHAGLSSETMAIAVEL